MHVGSYTFSVSIHMVCSCTVLADWRTVLAAGEDHSGWKQDGLSWSWSWLESRSDQSSCHLSRMFYASCLLHCPFHLLPFFSSNQDEDRQM